MTKKKLDELAKLYEGNDSYELIREIYRLRRGINRVIKKKEYLNALELRNDLGKLIK